MMIPFLIIAALLPKTSDRWVFLGDSITDGNTYPLIIEQALKEAKKDRPSFFNAGIGGDTSEGMLKRLDRDVFALHPTTVSISAGINDRMPVGEYERNIRAIVAAVRSHKAEPILLTTTTVDRPTAEVLSKLEGYNSVLRQIAEEEKLRLAEVQEKFKGKSGLFVEDGIHPNFEGHRLIARAVLDAVGHQSVPVPAKLKSPLMPGIIRQWQVCALKSDATVTAENLDTLLGQNKGVSLILPLQAGDPAIWPNQERMRGFAIELDKVVGSSDCFLSAGERIANREEQATILVGGDVRSVWVNGKRVYERTVYRGWHAHPAEDLVKLRKGSNRICVVSGTSFFVSLVAR